MNRPDVPIPRVTIILAAHADAPWIENAIYSVQAQSFTNWELICVLDAVSERVQAVVSSCLRDSRIRQITLSSNVGAGSARNEGLYAARGDLIAILDSDDEWTHQHLQQAVDYLDVRRKVVLVGSSYAKIKMDGTFEGQVVRAPRFMVKQMLVLRNCFAHSSVVYQRDLALKIGGYPLGVTVGEDYCLWLGMAKYGRVKNLNRVSVMYRVHEDQTSRKMIDQRNSKEILKFKFALSVSTWVPKWFVSLSHKIWLKRRNY